MFVLTVLVKVELGGVRAPALNCIARVEFVVHAAGMRSEQRFLIAPARHPSPG
jgi:hypothetical protein